MSVNAIQSLQTTQDLILAESRIQITSANAETHWVGAQLLPPATAVAMAASDTSSSFSVVQCFGQVISTCQTVPVPLLFLFFVSTFIGVSVLVSVTAIGARCKLADDLIVLHHALRCRPSPSAAYKNREVFQMHRARWKHKLTAAAALLA